MSGRDRDEHDEILAVQESMLADLSDEQRARYDALMNPHKDCESAPYCGCDPRCKAAEREEQRR